MSSELSRLILIRVNVMCVHVGTWVAEQSSGVALLCGRASVRGVRHNKKTVAHFWFHVSGRK